jgi:hypothetical protein
MDWADNARMSRLYKEMMCVMIDLQNQTDDTSEIELDGPQMLKSASDDLNHLIIDIQQNGPSETTKEQLLATIDKLKSAGRELFSQKPITSFTGVPEGEDV